MSADEVPDIGVETSELLLDRQKCSCILNGRCDLRSVADETRIEQQSLQFGLVVSRDTSWVEATEGAAIVLPLIENGRPTQSGLGAFEDQELEQPAIIVLRDAPFFVVVRDVRFASGPTTARSICQVCIHRMNSKQRVRRNSPYV